nr:Uma2 family endonuclease [uncultured Deefgea sp.]
MAHALVDEFVTPEQYLAAEELSEEKHEYFNGVVYPIHSPIHGMSGGSYAHDALAGNLFALCKAHLKGSGCRISSSNMRLKIESANCYFYPDLTIHCAAIEAKTLALTSARIVVEVLSPSTSNYDLGKKFDIYRQLDSLQEYVLIDSESKNVRVYRRAEHGDWVFHAYTHDETLRLASIDFSVSLTELYDDTGIEE